ncbi:Dioxygenase [Parafrankia irregularis]|uniref:Dioxygenase n=2 Tax=Parafrankia TaxID=2994362 RepID=A0A0S4QIL7_9ACTN|nr:MULTISPECIES: intradiol ring-cleavage dioxygenase [Parafrankia]MBE3200964.1 3,4-dioxygenase subunit beta [Parafrankia sp. CH37]CUU54636.1 Dioxygenase [Parafrankia irregularis]
MQERDPARRPILPGLAQRPAADAVDQDTAAGLGILVNRRRMLTFLGVGAASAGLAACGGSTDSTDSSGTGGATAASSNSAEIPEETAGPYPGDGSNGPDVLEQDGIIRSDIRSSFGDASGTAEGIPMTLELTITDLANSAAPFAGAAVYVWHCDRDGKYSLYSEGITGENYLRGVQVADESGVVRFTSIFPACYSGRWPHIHFEVYPDQSSITDSTKAIATSQVALPKEICDAAYTETGYEQSVTNLAQVTLDNDNVFGDDSAARQLGTVTGSATAGYQVSLTAGVDTTTAAGGGGQAAAAGGSEGSAEGGAGGGQPGGYGAPGGASGNGGGAPGGQPPSGAPGGQAGYGAPGGQPPSGAPGGQAPSA